LVTRMSGFFMKWCFNPKNVPFEFMTDILRKGSNSKAEKIVSSRIFICIFPRVCAKYGSGLPMLYGIPN